MRRRKRPVSLGTIVMILLTVVVLAAASITLALIRNPEHDVSMDAGRLAGSVAQLWAAVRMDAETELQPPAASETPLPQIDTPTPMPSATPVAQATSSVQTLEMTVAGEFSLHEQVLEGTRVNAEAPYAPQTLLSAIAGCVTGDVRLVLVDSEPLRAGETVDLCAQALRAARFDWATVQGNKPAAMSREALTQAFAAQGIVLAGSPSSYTLLQAGGLQMAVLLYAEGQGSGSEMTAYSRERAAQEIAAARQNGAQIVLAALRWKSAAAATPTSAQKKIAQELCDAGADMLIGLKPDRVASVAYVTSADSAHRMLVAWSMGTLLSESRVDRDAVSGALLHVQLQYDRLSGALDFTQVAYTPLYAWGQEENGRFQYRVLQNVLPVPETMIQRQQEIMGRSLTLIQKTMEEGIAVQR